MSAPVLLEGNLAAEIAAGDSLRLGDLALRFKVCVQTPWRWKVNGLPTGNGLRVRLEAIKLGKSWITSEAAVKRFFSALPHQEPVPRAATPYARVIPRDLFNESKLLKCLGQLSMLVLDGVDAKGRAIPPNLGIEQDGEPFGIEQDPSSGNLICESVEVLVSDLPVRVVSVHNSKNAFPLVFGDLEEPVFNDDGTLSTEFVDFCSAVSRGEHIPRRTDLP